MSPDDKDNKDNKDDKNTISKEDIEKLSSTLEGLPGLIQNAVMSGISQVVEQTNKGNQADDDDDDDNVSLSEKDLDGMSRSELVSHIVSSVDKKLKGPLKAIIDKMDDTSISSQKATVKGAIKEAQDKHDDFNEFVPEMKELGGKYPHLEIEDLYLLAKGNNPEKTKELSDKKSEADKENKQPAFGGLMATSGTKTTKTDKMNKNEAANSAWDDVMSEVPEEAYSGETP